MLFRRRHSLGTCLSNDSLEGCHFEFTYPSLIHGADGPPDLVYPFYRRAIEHLRLAPDILEVE